MVNQPKKYYTRLSVLVLCVLLFLTSVSISATQAPLQAPSYQYYTYDEMTTFLHQLQENYSDILTLTSIGTTHQNRDIWMVKLSDNPDQEEPDEPGVLLMGAHHGNEKPSYEVLLYFLDSITQNYTQQNIDNDLDGKTNEDHLDGRDNDGDGAVDEDPSEERIHSIIDSTELYIIPMVNPDGVEANTRKNGAAPYGVDLNRNYGHRWIFYKIFPAWYNNQWTSRESSPIYRGPEPFSEPESQAVKQVADTYDIVLSLSYHDYGEWMIFPWMHTSRRTPHEHLFRSIGRGMADINGYELRIYGQYGTREYLIPRFCGTLGTSENWLYAEHQILAYTIELCPSRAPLNPQTVLDACIKHVGVNLFVCEQSHTLL